MTIEIVAAVRRKILSITNCGDSSTNLYSDKLLSLYYDHTYLILSLFYLLCRLIFIETYILRQMKLLIWQIKKENYSL